MHNVKNIRIDATVVYEFAHCRVGPMDEGCGDLRITSANGMRKLSADLHDIGRRSGKETCDAYFDKKNWRIFKYRG